MEFRSASALVTLLLTISPSAQLRTEPAPIEPTHPQVLRAFAVRSADVQELSVPANRRESFQLKIVLAGKQRVLRVRPHGVLADDFRLLVDDGKSIRQVPTPLEKTYRGFVLGEANSTVTLSLGSSQLQQATITIGEVTWAVQPLQDHFPSASPVRHVVYRYGTSTRRARSCALHPRLATRIDKGGINPASAPKNVEMAIDCDNAFYRDAGSSVDRCMDAVHATMNAVDALYRRDLDLCLSVTEICVRTTPVYRANTTNALWTEMKDLWNRTKSSTRRDCAHMFSGVTAGAVGVAQTASVCNLTNAYAVSQTDAKTPLDNIVIIAHETGHMCGANHCDSKPPCHIMCTSGLGGCGQTTLKFGPAAQGEIKTYAARQTCLGSCPPPCSLGEYTLTGSACAGTGKGAGSGCLSQNFNMTVDDLFLTPDDNLYAIPVPARTQPRSVVSLDFYTRGTTARTMQTWIYRTDGFGTPAEPVGAASMPIGTTNAVSTARFSAPVVLAPNTEYYVVFKNLRDVFQPIATSGNRVATWIKEPNRDWRSNTRFQFPWSFRLNCTGANAAPGLTALSRPKLGAKYQIAVFNAKPMTLAVLFHAFRSNSVELTRFGAPRCFALTDRPWETQGAMTNAAGVAVFTQMVPQTRALCGLRFFHQGVVQDTGANALGLVTTRRGEPVLGSH